jgi:hypothetical protein
MAVQVITHKKITKFDVDDPNYKPLPQPKPEEVNGNVIEDIDLYGEKQLALSHERKHSYQPDNGNLQLSEFMTGVMNKLDGLTLNPNIVEKNRAIEVDIKREIAISKADINGVTSEEIKGKVMNKKDKLKALRRRNRK